MEQGNLAPWKETSDAALAAEAMGGCAVSLGLLFKRYRPQLYAAAVSLLGYTSDADDAVHDTFVTARACDQPPNRHTQSPKVVLRPLQ